MTPLYTIPDAPPPSELVSKHFTDPDPAVAALARLAGEARKRAVVCRTLLVRGSDGAGGYVIEDMYAIATAMKLLEESIAEMNHYASELASLVAQRKTP